MEKYRQIIKFSIGLHAICVQVRRDLEEQWLAMHYKLTNANMDAVVDEWATEWRGLVSVEEVSDTEAGPPPDDPMDKSSVHESDQDSREASSGNPIYSEAEWQYEETRTR